MAATPLRHIVDDLAKDFKQVFDDKIIQKSQIAYWVLTIGNRLRSQHIGKRDSGAFLSTYKVPIEIDSTTVNPSQMRNRKYFVLPKCIYDYDMDKGIEYISYYNEDQKPECPPPFTWVTFTRTTPSRAKRLYYNKFEVPNPKDPYYYRVGERIYTLGIEKTDPKFVDVGLYQTFNPVTEINLDDPFDFPQELIIQLTRQVLDLGRFVLLIPEERVNEGNSQLTQAIPTNKLTSVSELAQDQETNK